MPLRSSGILSDLWLISTPNTHNHQIPVGCIDQSVNFSSFNLQLCPHVLPQNRDQCSFILHSFIPRHWTVILALDQHLGVWKLCNDSCTLYRWNFLGLLTWTLMPLLVSAFSSWLLTHVNGLWNTHTHSVMCRWTHIYIFKIPYMQPVDRKKKRLWCSV